MKNHTIYKATHSYTQGSKPRKLLPYYVILEDFKAPDSACGVGHRFVGGWTEEWMRDLIFDAMVANKQCSHSKRKPRLRRPTAKETKWFNGDVICPVCESRCSEVDGKIGDHITCPGKKGYESHVVRVMDGLTITGEHWTCDYCSGSGMPCLGTRGRKEIGFAQEWTITDWLKREHPEVLARYEAAGLFFDDPYDPVAVWLPLAETPCKGWSSMSCHEKHKYGQSVGCEYCIVKDSARSCPLHGWPEKSKARYYEMFPEERKA